MTQAIFFGIFFTAGIIGAFRPGILIGAVFAFYGLEQWAAANDTWFIHNYRIPNYVLGASVLFSILFKMLRQEPLVSGLLSRTALLPIVLFALSFVSVLWSQSPEAAGDNWRKFFPYISLYVVIAPLLVSSERDLRDAVYSILLIGAVCVVLLATSQVVGRGVQMAESAYDTNGRKMTVGNPLAVATIAANLMLVAVLLNFRGAGRLWLLLRWGVVAAAGIVLLQSGSRGQLIAMLVSAVVFFPIAKKLASIKGFFVTIIGLAILGTVTLVLFQNFADQRRWEGDKLMKDTNARAENATAALSAWANSNPFNWVVGLGSSACFDERIVGYYPHVVPVEILAEEGIVGFGLFSAALIGAFAAIYRAWPIVRDDPERRGLLAVWGALIFAGFLISFKQGSLLGTDTLFLYMIVVARATNAMQNAAAAELANPQPEQIEPYYPTFAPSGTY